jgi:hypothetical protein
MESFSLLKERAFDNYCIYNASIGYFIGTLFVSGILSTGVDLFFFRYTMVPRCFLFFLFYKIIHHHPSAKNIKSIYNSILKHKHTII